LGTIPFFFLILGKDDPADNNGFRFGAFILSTILINSSRRI